MAGWEDKVKGPWINHSCCAVHCNCEYVPTEIVPDRKGGTFSVNVRTTQDVLGTGGQPVEFLADYGKEYLTVLPTFFLSTGVSLLTGHILLT